MVAINIFATLDFVASSVMALPAADAATGSVQLDERQLPPPIGPKPRVTFCKDPQWQGGCYVQDSDWNVCYNLNGEWNDQASSVKAENTNSLDCCTWYEHGNCGGRAYTNQNDAKLQDGNGFFNDRISSWKCEYRS
ncbi:hypothetical protein OQA88_4632 [Cercophora sp. LCS_1]